MEEVSNDDSVTIHHKNLQLLITEIFKVRNDLVSDIMEEVYHFNNPTYDVLSDVNIFLSQKIRAIYHVPAWTKGNTSREFLYVLESRVGLLNVVSIR